MLYRTRVLDAITAFDAQYDSQWIMADFTGTGTDDLCCILTSNTTSGMVEIQVASMESNYQTFVAYIVTAFPEQDDDSGIWKLIDFDGNGKLDLINIRNRDTETGMVEIYVLYARTDDPTMDPYQHIERFSTRIPCDTNGFYTLADTTGDGQLDVVFIKTKHTKSKKVEFYIATYISGYEQILHSVTACTTSAALNGLWSLFPYQQDNRHDLTCVTPTNTRSRSVELQVFSFNYDYRGRSVNTPTLYTPETNMRKTWLLSRYTHRTEPDIINIKPYNTNSGKVEIHILSAYSPNEAQQRHLEASNARRHEDVPDIRDLTFEVPMMIDPTELPKMIDLRPHCPKIWDQGDLNSSVANAVGSMYWYHSQNEDSSWEPSRLFIFYESRKLERTTSNNMGTSIRSGLQAIKASGVCSEDLWHYDYYPPEASEYIDGFEAHIRAGSKAPDHCYSHGKRHTNMVYKRILRDEKQLKACLAAGLPFVFGFQEYPSFGSAFYEGGIIDIPAPTEQSIGWHAVMAVGYTKYNDSEYFIIRNSWGAEWSDEKQCGLAESPGYCLMPVIYLMRLAVDFWTIDQLSF